jgi:hypothetical protein
MLEFILGSIKLNHFFLWDHLLYVVDFLTFFIRQMFIIFFILYSRFTYIKHTLFIFEIAEPAVVVLLFMIVLFCSVDTDPSPAGKRFSVVVARVAAAVPMVVQGMKEVVDDPLSATAKVMVKVQAAAVETMRGKMVRVAAVALVTKCAWEAVGPYFRQQWWP